MRVFIRFVSLMVLLAMVGGHDSASAAANTTITVTIGPSGSPYCTISGTSNPLEISQGGGARACGPLTILPKTTPGTAKVQVWDGNSDILKLYNTKITTSSDVSNVQIVVEREHDPGPYTSANPLVNVYYKTTADGAFISGGTGNSASLIGFIDHYSSSGASTGYVQMGTNPKYCNDPCTSIVLAQSWLWPRPPELQYIRKLKILFVFTLKQTSYLDLGTGLQIKNTGQAEPPNGCDTPEGCASPLACDTCPRPLDCTPKSQVSGWCKLVPHWFTCPLCVFAD